MKLSLKVNPVKFDFRWLLVVGFLLVLLYVAYVGYAKIYSSIFAQVDPVPEGSVVRVNLKAYEATMGYIEGLYNYEPPVLSLPRANPFQ